MRFQDIAKTFGMTIDQFAEVIGYRRQTLYCGIRKTAKSQEAIERLCDMNDQMLALDIETAYLKAAKRKAAISEFELRFKERGHDG